MKTEIFWIEGTPHGRLAIMPRPRGGDWLAEEVRSWRLASVDIVVSLLTADEIADLDLANEEELCRANGIRFMSLPIPDRDVPSSKQDVLQLATDLAQRLADGKNIAIHCRQGIGRAALVAICLLVVAGVDPGAATRQVSAARGCPVPETLEQKQWITKFANSLAAPTPK